MSVVSVPDRASVHVSCWVIRKRQLPVIFSKNGKRKYLSLVISHQKLYFVKYHSDSTHKYHEHAGIPQRQFLCSCWWSGLLTVCWFSMGTNCFPLLVDLFYIHTRGFYLRVFTLNMKRKNHLLGFQFGILIYL
jgi:hypothetical protein